MIKAVIFDFDGTLADRAKGGCNAYRVYLKEFVVKEKVDPVYFEAMIQDLMLLDQFGTINKKLIAEKFNRKYGYNIDHVHLYNWWVRNLGLYEPLFENTLKTLDYLKEKYKLGMITNGSIIGQNIKIDSTNIRHYFDSIIISDEFGKAKPDVSIFNESLKQLDVLPHEAIYVGDTYSNDIQGAYNAGITPIWIWSDDGRYNLDSARRIYRIEELIGIL